MSSASSIECRTSWVVAAAALAILTVAFGAPLVAVIALKPIAATLDSSRSIPAAAGAAASLGSAFGGLLMGWLADRVGHRRLAAFGLLMIGIGMVVSMQGGTAMLLLGHGVLVGFLGLASLFAPLVTLVSRWFDRRRGTAVALVSSGQYMAGVLWPTLIEIGVERYGWQRTMLVFGVVGSVAVLPLCLLLRPAPVPVRGALGGGPSGGPVLGLSPWVAQAAIALAIFLCCVPMAIPQGHLVALCSDLGILPARGAAMMSVMLGLAFTSRQLWGWMADRYGSLPTLMTTSALQAASLIGFFLTQDEAGLFVMAGAFGLGFSGLVPAYVMAVREYFPDREAGWRVPIVLLAGQGGMAAGGWLAGAIYDWAGGYGPAFVTGVVFNLVNLVLLGLLIGRRPARGLALA